MTGAEIILSATLLVILGLHVALIFKLYKIEGRAMRAERMAWAWEQNAQYWKTVSERYARRLLERDLRHDDNADWWKE